MSNTLTIVCLIISLLSIHIIFVQSQSEDDQHPRLCAHNVNCTQDSCSGPRPAPNASNCISPNTTFVVCGLSGYCGQCVWLTKCHTAADPVHHSPLAPFIASSINQEPDDTRQQYVDYPRRRCGSPGSFCCREFTQCTVCVDDRYRQLGISKWCRRHSEKCDQCERSGRL